MTAPSTGGSSDLDLVHASKNGDVGAFEELVKRYDRKLFRIAQSVTHNIEDSQDAVQEALLKAFQKLDQFREESQFSTWLVRITVNQSLMKLRKSRAIRKVTLNDWASELRLILINALSELELISRTVFVLRDIEGLSTDQTADILNLSPTAVKARLWRSRLQLREHLNKYFGKQADSDSAQLVPLNRRTGRILGLIAECLSHSSHQARTI